ncbi:MAG: ATP-binding protein, partial [Leptospiraceae bacterium]|nr:ATP-binding protein [Leptospiraceae bacterium]
WPEGMFYTEKYVVPIMLISHALGLVWGTTVSLRALKKGVQEARIIVIGYVVFMITTLLDILGYLNLTAMVGLTEEGFMAFVFCMGIALSSAFSTAHKQKEKLVDRLRANIGKLMQTQQVLEFSEEKYRHLVENSAEVIFSLSTSGEILTINRQSQTLLGRSPRKLVGRNITELAASTTIGSVLMREKIEEVVRGRCRVSFPFDFRNILGEPRQMNVVLQFIPDSRNQSDGTVYGRATGYIEDSLGQYLFSEKQTYFLANYITLGDQMSQRLTQHLHHYISSDEIAAIKMGLREMIINAMEHGNLNITYEEKSRATREGTYIQLFRERQVSEKFKDRKVKIDYVLTQSYVGFRIADEGPGFDHRSMLREGATRANEERLSHGRGIQIAKNEFDTLKYNSKGNQVTLVKKFELIRGRKGIDAG